MVCEAWTAVNCCRPLSLPPWRWAQQRGRLARRRAGGCGVCCLVDALGYGTVAGGRETTAEVLGTGVSRLMLYTLALALTRCAATITSVCGLQ